MTKLNKVTRGLKVGRHKVEWNTDCDLHGYWGEPECSPNTMVTQWCLLGITSVQLEIPRSLRKLIANSNKLIQALAKAILEIYSELIVPLWKERETPVAKFNKSWADSVE